MALTSAEIFAVAETMRKLADDAEAADREQLIGCYRYSAWRNFVAGQITANREISQRLDKRRPT